MKTLVKFWQLLKNKLRQSNPIFESRNQTMISHNFFIAEGGISVIRLVEEKVIREIE